jgi:hypothetical protein
MVTPPNESLIHQDPSPVPEQRHEMPAVLSVRQLVQNVARIQSAMREVMKEGIHYGKIPGTPRPTLLKPGAEVLCLMFRIAIDPDRIEDLSAIDPSGLPYIRYRVRLRFTSQVSGVFLGSAWGDASSLEEKYKWRRATGRKEFDATLSDHRRVKMRRGQQKGSEWEEFQIRTEAEDISNTILQMAIKRAEVSGTRRVTACSDIFGQDLEDLPKEILESITDTESTPGDAAVPVKPGPRKSSTPSAAPAPALEPEEPTADAPAPSGTIANITRSPTGAWLIRLSTGFVCGTRDKALAAAAEAHALTGATIELRTQAHPGFMPTLEEIVAAPESDHQE